MLNPTLTTREPYWTKYGSHVDHCLLAECTHSSGKWEMFVVSYSEGHQEHDGGNFRRVEFYWEGDFQESFPFIPVTNYREQLDQFIGFWLMENEGNPD